MLQKENLKLKFRLIYLPFITISVGFITCYTLFNYLFYQTEILKWNLQLINLWLPIILPWIPILIWLRPGINLLRLKQKNGKDLDMLYYIVAWFAATVPTVITQDYLEDAAGALSPLSSVEQIADSPSSKFYTLKEYYIDKKHLGIEQYSELSGKHNEYLNFTVFVACPILKKKLSLPKPLKELNQSQKKPLIVIDGNVVSPDTLATIDPHDIEKLEVIKGKSALQIYGVAAKYGALLITMKANLFYYSDKGNFTNSYHTWLCLRYDKQISSRLDKEEKEKLYNEFIQNSEREFESTDPTGFQYLKRMPWGSDRTNYLKALKNSTNENSADPHLLLPVYESFSERGGEKPGWILKTFLIACGLFAVMLLFPKLNTAKVRLYYNPKPKQPRTLSMFLMSIRNMAALSGTFSLISINVIIFIIMVFKFEGFLSFQIKDLLVSGANFRPLIKAGEWWRLFTSMFLHGGFMHLFLNMYGLLFAGIFIEPILGRARFILFYLVIGLVGSLSSIWWYDAIVSVGASGAIFGLYGIFLILLLTNVFPNDFRKEMLLNTAFYVGINLIIGLAGGIDNAAHMGGLLCGALIGLLIFSGLKKRVKDVKVSKPTVECDE